VSFLTELRRRHVYRAAILYAVVGFTVMEGADIVAGNLDLPADVSRIVTIVVLLGFPITLVLAFIYDLTWKGPVRTEPPAEMLGADREVPYIVVLPFRFASDDQTERTTAEGLTDDVTTLLTSVRGIRVAPRQSVGRELLPGDDPFAIARGMGGRYALTGGVRRGEDRLRVSCELTDLDNNEQVWSRRFDEAARDLFVIQDEIAKGVVAAVGGAIARVEAARALRHPPESLRAWELTRRAMSVAWDWRPATLERAMHDLRKAIELDPNYALAHGWLANNLAWRSAAGWSQDNETERQQALREADEALRLGFDDGEALWPALQAYWAAREPARSVRAYEQVTARNPQIFLAWPFGTGGAGVAYARIGQVDEGVALIREFEKAFPGDEWGAVWGRVLLGYSELCRRNYRLAAESLANPPSEHDGMCRVVALVLSDAMDEAIGDFTRLKEANPAIDLDHYIEYFKDYHATDRSIGRELSNALVHLKSALATRS
jgi:TolB-like protein